MLLTRTNFVRGIAFLSTLSLATLSSQTIHASSSVPRAALAASAAVTAAATTPNCQPGSGVFTACFYYGTSFNTFALQRQDPQINFDWQWWVPYPNGPLDQFSVRWEGDFNFATAGSYRFSVSADDGARLFVDGQQILDRWTTSSGLRDIRRKHATYSGHPQNQTRVLRKLRDGQRETHVAGRQWVS